MNVTPDTTAGPGGTFDPREAAALLDQTTRQARRQFEPAQPWLLAIRAVLVLAALGAVWLSVRGQHPYKGPGGSALLVVAAFVVINFTATVAVRRRATAGVSGKSRLRPAEITVLALAWIAVFPLIGAMVHAGVSNADVYSLIPLTVPLIIAGLTWAAIMAARGGWREFGTGLGVAAVGAAGLLTGPVAAWAVAGVGLCLVLLGSAAAIVWRQRRSVARP
jgi:hypothetical protein